MIFIYTIYADGSSIKKPCVAWGSGAWLQQGNVTIAKVGGKSNSNIFAELIAIREALKWGMKSIAKNSGETLQILTDSKYSVDCMVNWRANWQNPIYVNQNDGTDVKSPDKKCFSHWNLVSDMWGLIDALKFSGVNVEFKHIRGHGKDANMSEEDINGNLQADLIATDASMSAALSTLVEYDLGYSSQSDAKLRILAAL